MLNLWGREDVALGEVFTRDEVGVGSGAPLLYQVVGINDRPTVVLRALDSDEPSDNEWYVIGSPSFAEFRKVVTLEAPGPPVAERGEEVCGEDLFAMGSWQASCSFVKGHDGPHSFSLPGLPS